MGRYAAFAAVGVEKEVIATVALISTGTIEKHQLLPYANKFDHREEREQNRMAEYTEKFPTPFTPSLLTELAGHLKRAAEDVDPVATQERAKAVRNVLDSGLHLARTPIAARHRAHGKTLRPIDLSMEDRTREANVLIEIKKARELFVARRTKMRSAIGDLNKLK